MSAPEGTWQRRCYKSQGMWIPMCYSRIEGHACVCPTAAEQREAREQDLRRRVENLEAFMRESLGARTPGTREGGE